MRSSIWLILIFLNLMASQPAALASGFTLEAGMFPTLYFPTGSEADQNHFGGGVSGTASYELIHWGFGGRVFGALSSQTNFHIDAGSVDLKGQLKRRYYGLDALARYFFLDSEGRKRWYIELGFMGVETDLVHQGNVYVLPQSPNYTRLFLRGGGFSIGAGYRPIKGPLFFQLNYELVHYENLEIVGEVKYLHPILMDPPLNNNYFIHTVVLTVGLDVFGR